MANREHVAKLKEGAKTWNAWREEDSRVRVNLSEADLFQAKLEGANLSWANLSWANFHGANLSEANLSEAKLEGAKLEGAKLEGAKLSWANFSGADLSWANFSGADLSWANFSGANLEGANLNNAILGGTVFVDVDLSGAKNLETVLHQAPSSIGIDTLYKSKGKIPEEFLRGAGVPEEHIGHFLSVIRSVEPVKFYSCFISYSSADDDFASRLYAKMLEAHLRVWKASEDLKIGDEFRDVIDRAIRVRDKLLITLSETSIESRWVKDEVETALDEERERKTAVLFPIRIDDAVMETTKAWARLVRTTRHIGDFSEWKDHDAFEAAFARLYKDLKDSKGAG